MICKFAKTVGLLNVVITRDYSLSQPTGSNTV